jgi:hypothetical protein
MKRSIKHNLVIVAFLCISCLGYGVKCYLQQRRDIAEVLLHGDYLQVEITKHGSEIEIFFLSEHGKVSAQRRGECLAGLCILLDEDLSPQDAIPILQVFKDGGVRDILMLYADRQRHCNFNSKAMNTSKTVPPEKSIFFSSIYDNIRLISTITDTNLLQYFTYADGGFPINICCNVYKKGLFSYNYVIFNEPFEITCFLRLWDNEEAKKRGCDLLSEGEAMAVLQNISSNIKNNRFSYPVVVRDSWTGNARYVINARGVIVIPSTCKQNVEGRSIQ